MDLHLKRYSKLKKVFFIKVVNPKGYKKREDRIFPFPNYITIVNKTNSDVKLQIILTFPNILIGVVLFWVLILGTDSKFYLRLL